MLKFLRKYNKFILVVGGALLMVAFLMPQAIQQFGFDPGERTVAKIGDEQISLRELDGARREIEAIDPFLTPDLKQLLAHEDAEHHWLLLSRLAEQAGTVGEDQDGVSYVLDFVDLELARQARMFRQNIPADQVEQIRQNTLNAASRMATLSRMPEGEYFKALAKARGIIRLRSEFLADQPMSRSRLLEHAATDLEQIYLDYLFIPGNAVELDAEPTEAELQAHFEQYRDAEPGTGEHGIGYRLPERVKIAWMAVDTASLAGQVEIDPVEVRKRFERQFGDAEFTAEAKASIENELRSEQVDRIRGEISRVVEGEIQRRLRTLDEDADGYYILGDDWSPPSYEELAQRIVDVVKNQSDTTIPLPAVHVRQNEWLTRSDLLALPGIGGARFKEGTNTTTLPDVALQVKELAGINNRRLQVGVPITSLEPTGAGRLYYFTILDAREPSPAETLDEVRDEVVENVHFLRGYDRLQEEASRLLAVATTDGLDVLARSYDDHHGDEDGPTPEHVHVEVRENQQVRSYRFPGFDDDETLKSTVAAIARSLDPLVPATEAPIEDRSFATPIPGRMGLMVGTVTAFRPLTETMFVSTMQMPEYIAFVYDRELSEVTGKGFYEIPEFSFDHLKAYFDYTIKEDVDADEAA